MARRPNILTPARSSAPQARPAPGAVAALALTLAIFMDTLQALVSLVLLVIPLVGPFIGIAFNICISATLGVLLSFLLRDLGLYKPGRVVPAFLGEMLPVINNLPVWTGATLFAILRGRTEAARQQSPSQSTAEEKNDPSTAPSDDQAPRPPRPSIDGIRARNDNTEREDAPVSAAQSQDAGSSAAPRKSLVA